MGRAGRPNASGGDLRGASGGDRKEALETTRSMNDYLDLESYGSSRQLSEAVSIYEFGTYQSDVSREDYELAMATVKEIEGLASDYEKRSTLGEQEYSPEGLRLAETIFRDLSEDNALSAENSISERMDPDGEFLFQTDGDHYRAMADYMSALRTGEPAGSGTGDTGIREAYADHIGHLADLARDSAKYS